MILKTNEEALLYSIANNLPVNDNFQPKTTSEALLAQIAKNGSTQPDLSQNDPNAPDFVKNRTHYEGFATIIEEREVRAWFDAGGFAASRIPQVGEKLTVTLNGNAYKCTVWEIKGHVALGNGMVYGINEGENVPFFAGFVEDDEDGTGALILTTTIGENTISIVDDSGNTLLEGTFNIEINVDDPCFSRNINLDQPLIVGNTYKVVYDGVPYECVAWEDGDIGLGNGEIDGYLHSEDVPFMIGTYYADGGWFWYLAFYGGDSHIVSVSEVVVHKLDPQYLPNAADTADYQERTHWDTRETKEVTFFEETIEMNFSNTTYPCEQEIHSGDTVNIYIDGELKHTVTATGSDTQTYINPSPDFSIIVTNADHEMTIYNGQYSGLCKFVVATESGELKQLDEKYIPDSIARTAEVKAVQEKANAASQHAGIIGSKIPILLTPTVQSDGSGYTVEQHSNAIASRLSNGQLVYIVHNDGVYFLAKIVRGNDGNISSCMFVRPSTGASDSGNTAVVDKYGSVSFS